MKSIVATLTALATLSCAADERPSMYRLGFRRSPGGGANDYTMILAGVDYTSRDAFIKAVAKLPMRSRLVWDSGCISLDEIPLGPAPRMSIVAFRTFCSSHGVRFEYRCGLATEPLITKTFSVPSTLSAGRTDAREWLQSRGVTFPTGSSARWEASRHSLAACNTKENIELIELLLQTLQPK